MDALLGHQRKEGEKKEIPFSYEAPDLKNGAGGLRDYQGVLWMAKVKFEDDALGSLVNRGYLNESDKTPFREGTPFFWNF